MTPTMKFTIRNAKRGIAFGLVLAVSALSFPLHAQPQEGKAVVRAVQGQAVYAAAGAPAAPLKVGTVLGSGATIKTAGDSTVDLFLGSAAGVVRVTENTTVAVDKLTVTETGADTVVEVQLNLPEGSILGNVNKLSAASRYEIKVPNGVAGIRGTRYRIGATAFLVCLDGQIVFVYVPPGGQPTPYTLNAPPPVYFSPIGGVQPAPPDLVNEVRRQFTGGGAPGDLPPVVPPPLKEPFIDPDLSDDTPEN